MVWNDLLTYTIFSATATNTSSRQKKVDEKSQNGPGWQEGRQAQARRPEGILPSTLVPSSRSSYGR